MHSAVGTQVRAIATVCSSIHVSVGSRP